MASSTSLILVVLAFLLTAVQSHLMHGLLADKGLPRGILPDTFSSFSVDSTGLVIMELKQDLCIVLFESTVADLAWSNPIRGNLSMGKLEFSSGVSMRKLPNDDIIRVKKIVAPFPHQLLIIEFWSSEKDLTTTVLSFPFSSEKPCMKSSRENPGAMLTQV